MSMSSGSITSSMPTMEETAMLPSFTPPSTAMWEWQSMMPGSRYIPVASITVAPAGAFRFLPTAAILPLRMSTSPFSIVPLVTVSTVAFLISVTWSWAPAAGATRAATANISRAERIVRFMVGLLELPVHGEPVQGEPAVGALAGEV